METEVKEIKSCQIYLSVAQCLGRKIPWKRKWQPTPVFLPGKFHGQRNLVGYSPWACKRARHDLATKQCEEMILFLLCRSCFQTCKLYHFLRLSSKHAEQKDSGVPAKKAPPPKAAFSMFLDRQPKGRRKLRVEAYVYSPLSWKSLVLFWGEWATFWEISGFPFPLLAAISLAKQNEHVIWCSV